jgi:pimeloyl-ACP methyl ester carboxylesterase
MAAFLADREGFDPASWDADQERAARATVVETAAGRVVAVTRPHVVAGVVDAFFGYRPDEVLPRVTAPIVALMAAEDEAGTRGPALRAAEAVVAATRGHGAFRVARFPSSGHNLMRYRPAEVTAAILGIAGRAGA